MESLGQKLRITYYDASDGPRIVIFGPLDADFQNLQQAFTQLSQSPGETCELHKQPFVASFGGTSLVLVCSGPMFGKKRDVVQGIRRVAGSTLPIFNWQRTAEGWDYLAELISSLVKSQTPGHQYLTRYPAEDAIVVVSKGEYGDDVLDR